MLLPVLPVHIAVELPMGWPLSLVLALFATNCTEAIVTAGVVWLLSDSPARFDTPRRLSTFFLAIVLGTSCPGFSMPLLWPGSSASRIGRCGDSASPATSLPT